jgi:hypothetical protein
MRGPRLNNYLRRISQLDGIFAWLAGLVITWIVVAIPTYFAAKIIVGRNATIWRAMLTTLIGPIVYAIVLFIASLFTFAFAYSTAIASLLAFLAWAWVFKRYFRTSWFRAIGVDILSTVIAWIIVSILSLIGVALVI